jgi:uncharacterized protein YjiK
MKKYFPLLLVIACCSLKGVEHLKPYEHHSLNISEPSDICLTSDNPSHYYIVSNRGSIAETDSNGKVLRKSKRDGSDYEAVCVKDHMIYAIDESLRRVDVINESDFKVRKSMVLHFAGGRNKAFEGLTYIPSQKKFITATETPVIVFELNEQLQVINQIQLKQFRELSALTYHDNYLWFLSDEDHEVMKVDPADYSIVKRWSIPVINPEGICFDEQGNLLIVSDDMEELFKFKIQ